MEWISKYTETRELSVWPFLYLLFLDFFGMQNVKWCCKWCLSRCCKPHSDQPTEKSNDRNSSKTEFWIPCNWSSVRSQISELYQAIHANKRSKWWYAQQRFFSALPGFALFLVSWRSLHFKVRKAFKQRNLIYLEKLTRIWVWKGWSRSQKRK